MLLMCFLSHPYTFCNENTKIRGNAFWLSHPTAPRNVYFCKFRGNKNCGLAAFCVEPALGRLPPFSLPLSPHTHSFSLSLSLSLSLSQTLKTGATGWLSQWSIWVLVSAQVMFSHLVNVSLAQGAELTVGSLLRILSPPNSLPLLHSCCFCLFQKKKNYKKK